MSMAVWGRQTQIEKKKIFKKMKTNDKVKEN